LRKDWSIFNKFAMAYFWWVQWKMVSVNSVYRFFSWYVLDLSRLGMLLSKAATAKLRALAAHCRRVEDYVDLTLNFRWGFKPLHIRMTLAQVKDEILKLTSLLDNLKPRAVLEIGTGGGGTLFLWSRVASVDARIISIDLPGGSFGGGYARWKMPFYKSFARSKQRIYLIRGDSHDLVTFRDVARMLESHQLDFLFMDGDHSYEGVKKDFEMYSPLVGKGGIIAFHDIVPHSSESGCEVSKFWNQVKDSHKHLEIVKDQNQKWAGIGLLFI